MNDRDTRQELTVEELEEVIGGDAKAPPPPPPKHTGLFEVEDFSFD